MENDQWESCLIENGKLKVENGKWAMDEFFN
jgi:hypothetical protein